MHYDCFLNGNGRRYLSQTAAIFHETRYLKYNSFHIITEIVVLGIPPFLYNCTKFNVFLDVY